MLSPEHMTLQQLAEVQALIEARIRRQGTCTSVDSTELDQIQAELDRRVIVEQCAKVTSEEMPEVPNARARD